MYNATMKRKRVVASDRARKRTERDKKRAVKRARIIREAAADRRKMQREHQMEAAECQKRKDELEKRRVARQDWKNERRNKEELEDDDETWWVINELESVPVVLSLSHWRRWRTLNVCKQCP